MGGAQDSQGSVMAFLMQYQKLLNKEAGEDRQLLRQEQAQRLEGQSQEQHGDGFFQNVCNFMTGSDAGSGSVERGSTFSEKAHQPQTEWKDWKFLKLR
jgi:hypothetical protein